MVIKVVPEMKQTPKNEMETLIQEVKLCDGCEAPEQTDAAGKQMTNGFIKRSRESASG